MLTEEELDDLCESVKTRQDLSNFVNLLREDLNSNQTTWENRDLDSFLEAMSGWVQDMNGYYSNMGVEFSENQSWKTFADILMASRTYE